jgi:hypothetical protein
LAVAEQEFQQARKDNQALAWYIITKRKKEEARNKSEEDAAKKAK